MFWDSLVLTKAQSLSRGVGYLECLGNCSNIYWLGKTSDLDQTARLFLLGLAQIGGEVTKRILFWQNCIGAMNGFVMIKMKLHLRLLYPPLLNKVIHFWELGRKLGAPRWNWVLESKPWPLREPRRLSVTEYNGFKCQGGAKKISLSSWDT